MSVPQASPFDVVALLLADDILRDPAITVRLIDAVESRPPVFAETDTIHFSSSEAVVERAFMKWNVVYREAGQYRPRVWSEGHLLKECRLTVWRANVNGRFKK